jgi:hypothetical protein
MAARRWVPHPAWAWIYVRKTGRSNHAILQNNPMDRKIVALNQSFGRDDFLHFAVTA